MWQANQLDSHTLYRQSVWRKNKNEIMAENLTDLSASWTFDGDEATGQRY